ncbi:hypothetical protein CC86DRAFT_461962 [Ophiobolus disseminans]|uniref:Uncharacterized protein n=1 Tax=Ophiobolus disseminans TaxID=1469910 RepID=A0A6A7AK85_9PLEO|nr:hypothetical protein CC86DRAFT_461962 [Ophiobolus disseminans]
MADHQTIMAHNQRNSPLLRLPAELRNSIYQYALSSSKVVVHLPLGDPLYRGSRLPVSLRFLTTCRQIYHETRDIFWASATFEFRDHCHLHEFVEHIAAPKKTALITSIEINVATAYGFKNEVPAVKDSLPSLQRVHVQRPLKIGDSGTLNLLLVGLQKDATMQEVGATYGWSLNYSFDWLNM